MAIPKARDLTIQETKDVLAIDKSKFTLDTMRDLFAARMGEDHPRFNTYDRMILPPTEKFHNSSPIKTTVGRYIFNLICLPDKYLKKFGYMNDALSKKKLGKMETKMGEMILRDELSTHEYAEYMDRAEWIGMGSAYFLNPTMNYDINVPIPEVIQRRDELFDKYKDEVAEGSNEAANAIEKDVLTLAKQKLKEKHNEAEDFYDANGTGSGICSFDNNYKKTSIMGGAMENPYTKKLTILKSNYTDGVDPKEFPEMSNLTLIGGYSRGVSTQDSGYERKKIDNTVQNIVLDEKGSDCGTPYSVLINIPSNLSDMFLYRYIIEGGKLVLLTPENISKYVGKPIHMRSPMFCKGEKICNKCAGELFYMIGIKNAGLVTDSLSGTMLNKSMKKFHDTSIHFSTLDIEKYIIPR